MTARVAMDVGGNPVLSWNDGSSAPTATPTSAPPATATAAPSSHASRKERNENHE